MRTHQQFDQLREEAVALRLAGKSVREIREALGPVGKRTLSAALDGTPPAEWTHRPNAKDDLRDRARELRTRGPDRKANHVSFINSDPRLVAFFLRFLYVVGVDRGDLILRVYIHENADAEAAQRFWLDVTGANPSQFRSPTLKRHNPKTVRTNVGEDYHRCLRVDVRRSAALYRRIEGWALAAMTPGALNAAQDEPVSWCG